MYKCVKVAVDKATIQYDKIYDYYVPENTSFDLKKGCRVTVPFGGFNKRRTAMVLDTFEVNDREGMKPVSTQVDREPILNDEGIEILKFMKKYCFCTYFEGINAILPGGVGLKLDSFLKIKDQSLGEQLLGKKLEIFSYIKENKNKVSKKKLCKNLSIKENDALLNELIDEKIIEEENIDKKKISDEKAVMAKLLPKNDNVKKKPTEKQKLVLDMLEKAESASIKEICYFTGVGKGVITNLEKNGFIETFEKNIYRDPFQDDDCESEEIVLSKSQNEAFEKLKSLCDENEYKTALLYGITGSGKTSVFIKLIEYVLKKGQKVIVMVPEISLTPQTVNKFRRIFGDRTAVLHSGLTMAQRTDQWRKIRDKKADIVIGTRSAVFAPVENVGLIVMDEEQEHSYKSDVSPRFHARDIAAFRCKYNKALHLLSSATPSIESYYNAQNNKYTLVKLTERYSGAILPEVYVVDMKESIAQSSISGISQTVMEEICQNLKRGEQSILLLNRRGYHPMIKCSVCGETLKCPNCSVPLNYHSDNERVMCHYCGYSSEAISKCPSCGSKMIRYTGVGTQKAEEFLKENFPEAKILRMDTDSNMERDSYEKNFSDFAEGKYDIMIGTQMVAKGLNFPKVTLVAVLTADQSLFSQSFRGYERAFDLITQVVGRGGRGSLPGRAYIQTSVPDNPIIEYASRQDYDEFYAEEILFRKINLYPPFCMISCLGFTGENEKLTSEAAAYCCGMIKNTAESKYPHLPIRTMMPVPAAVAKTAGKYRYNVLIKHSRKNAFYEMLRNIFTEFSAIKKYKNINMYIDTNYDE